MTKVLSPGRAVSYAWRMTITARLRLFLAVLALALPPMGAVAAALTPPVAVMAAEECGGHDCPASTHGAASAHDAATACALGCLQAQAAPLLLTQTALPHPVPRLLPLTPSAHSPLSPLVPSPPERPPRA